MRIAKRSAAVAAALSAGLLVSAQFTPTATKVSDLEMVLFANAPDTSHGGLLALGSALATGSALPAGWQVADDLGRVIAHTTGLVDPLTGEFMVNITAVDDLGDMETVELVVDGAVVATATWSNGQIQARGADAIAAFSLPFAPSLPIQCAVRITSPADSNGNTNELTFDVEFDA